MDRMPGFLHAFKAEFVVNFLPQCANVVSVSFEPGVFTRSLVGHFVCDCLGKLLQTSVGRLEKTVGKTWAMLWQERQGLPRIDGGAAAV